MLVSGTAAYPLRRQLNYIFANCYKFLFLVQSFICNVGFVLDGVINFCLNLLVRNLNVIVF